MNKTKTCTKCNITKNIDDFHNAKKNNDGKSYWCKICVNVNRNIIRDKTRKISNKVSNNKICCVCEIEKQINEFHKDKTQKDGHKHFCKVCAKIRRKIQHRTYYDNNSEKIIQSQLKYAKENPEIIRAKNAKRRAAKLNATVSWSNKEKIDSVYKEARELELEDGIKRHVDHIIPLQGENVCGLHVENNLQILTSEENHKKTNKF
jgi:hypothetical protein